MIGSLPTAAPVPATMSKVAVFLAVVTRAAPRLIEASLIPTALFYTCLVLAGVGAAYAVAVIWLYAAVGVRLVRHRPVPPLLVLAAIGITVRTTVSLASGSTFVYFAQSVLGSLVVGCVFLVSIALGRPMVQSLALEFWPLTPEMLEHPNVRRLLRRLTYLWAGVNFAIGATTLTLLIVLPLPMYVATKQLVAWGLMGAGIAITIDRAVRTADARASPCSDPPAAAFPPFRWLGRDPPSRGRGASASRSFPVSVRGKSSWKSKLRGTLKPARPSRANAVRSATSASSPDVPRLQLHRGLHLLAELVVGHAEHGDVGHGGVA